MTETVGLTFKKIQEDYLSYSKFAKALGVSPTSVAKYLTHLFVRDGRNLYLPLRHVQVLMDMKNEGKSKGEILNKMMEIGKSLKTVASNENISLTLKKPQADYLPYSKFAKVLGVSPTSVAKYLSHLFVRDGHNLYLPIRDVQVLMDMKNEGKSKGEISHKLREIGKPLKTVASNKTVGLTFKEIQEDYIHLPKLEEALGVSRSSVTKYLSHLFVRDGRNLYLPLRHVQVLMDMKNEGKSNDEILNKLREIGKPLKTVTSNKTVGLTFKEIQEDYILFAKLTETLGVHRGTIRNYLAHLFVTDKNKSYLPLRHVQVLMDMKNKGKSKDEILNKLREIGRSLKTEGLNLEELERDYYTPHQASEMLGIRYDLALNFFSSVTMKTTNGYYIPKSEVQHLLEFKDKTVRLDKVLAEVVEEHGFTEQKNLPSVTKFIQNSGITVIRDVKNPFDSKTFINKVDVDKVKKLILKKVKLDNARREGDKAFHKLKLEIMLDEEKNSLIPETTKEFQKFSLSRIKTKGITFPMMEGIYKLLLGLEKELMEHTDEEMELLVGKILQEQTNKDTTKEFCQFINLLKNKYPTITRYVRDYNFDKKTAEKNSSKKETLPYTEEQFFRFGLLLLNDTHQWFEEYIERATTQRFFASVWLYCLLHYVCAWRSIDMLHNLPHPELPIDTSTGKPMVAEKFIEVVKTGQFTQEMALNIIIDVKMKIDYFYRKPEKTKKFNPPNLQFEPPTSAHYRLGMLLGLCEAHRRCSKYNKTLLAQNSDNKKKQQDFFGPEFIKIFGDNTFNNERGNKTYLNLLAKKGDEKQLGSGHVLASIARSHKFSLGKFSDTTSIYLKYYSSMTNTDVLMKELFERGVCSFVPFLLLMTLEGEEAVKKLTQVEQTKKIKELVPYSPYDGERLLVIYDQAIEQAKLDVQRIVQHYSRGNKLNVEEIHKFLDKIACNTAPAKEENMNCISVAMGNSCIYPERECIGCGQEIYLFSSLHLVGQQVRGLADKVAESKTQASKWKYEMILKQVIKPILSNIITTLKCVYGIEDLSLYKEIAYGTPVKNEVLQ